MASTKNNQIEEWLDDEDNLFLLESWARDGYTIQDIAMRVGVHVSTFRGWMADYPEIKKAVNTGRELVDYKVENALLKAALGYKTREVKVVATMKHGRIIEERKETTDKEFAPNVYAITAWLYNRQPKKWKNMNSSKNMFDELDEDTSIHITVERATPANIDSDDMSSEDSYNEENTINSGVSIRKATKAEQQEAEKTKAAKQADSGHDAADEDWEQWLKDDDSEVKTSTANTRNKSTKKKSTQSNTATGSAKASVHSDAIQHVDDDDIDYWPDDWQDE